jgi:hypothetical protein
MLTITEPECCCTRIDVDLYDVAGCPLCDPHSEYNQMLRDLAADAEAPAVAELRRAA